MIEWRMTSATKFRFHELILLLEDTIEDSDEAEAIKESIKSLPGFPDTGDENVHIQLEVTDVQH